MQLLFQLLICSLISHITPGSLSKLYRPHHNVTIIVMGVSQKCSFLPQFSIVLDVSPVDTAVPMLLSCISPVTVYSSIWNTHHECRRFSLTETIGFPHLLVYDLCYFTPWCPFFSPTDGACASLSLLDTRNCEIIGAEIAGRDAKLEAELQAAGCGVQTWLGNSRNGSL
jgi:hypothetical protein